MVVPSLPFPDASMRKPELRAAMRAARKAYVAGLSAAERDAQEQALAAHLAPLLAEARQVAGYHAVGSEIDLTAELLSFTPAFPMLVGATAPMRFCLGTCDTAAPWAGGMQPDPDATPVEPDLVLIPLLAVDPSGHRLGQGGGHYDRALPALRQSGARLVGVGWAMQRLAFALPADQWDVPLDAFVSPAGLEHFR